MITLILGQNSIGKSYTLNQIRYNSKDSVVSNYTKTEDLVNRKYNKERIDIIENNKYIENIEYNNSKISITSEYEISNNLEKLVYIMCKKSDILLLDEPELELSEVEISILMSIIYSLADTFKEIYIVSHSNTALFLMTHPNSRLCTVKTEGNQMKMVEIDKDKAYETID